MYIANTLLYSGMELSTLHHVPGVHREQHPGGPHQVTENHQYLSQFKT